jgi:hypothetical protein
LALAKKDQPVAIALRGAPVTAVSTAGGSVTLPLSSIAGLAQNDVVVIFSCEAYASGSPDPVVSSSGWNDIFGKGLNANNTLATRVQFKRMGATPDTSAVVTGSGVAGNGVAAIAIAFSGVSTAGQVYGGPSASVAGTSTTPDPPPQSSVTTDGTVVILAGMAPVTSPSSKPLSPFTSPTPSVADAAATRPATIDIVYLLGFSSTTGSYDPPAFAAFSAAATPWAAFTISLQPDRAAAVAGIPSPTGAYLYNSDQTHFLYDYQGNRWWCTSDAKTIANGNWAAGGGAYSVLIDWQGHTWVNNHSYSNPPSNWYYWNYSSNAWVNQPTGPISQIGSYIQTGDQYSALVDANGDVWTANRLVSGNTYYIDKNGSNAGGGTFTGYLEYANSPLGGQTIWAGSGTNWFYWNGSAWVSTSPPNITFPSAIGLTVGSPGIVDPSGPKAFAATEVNNQVLSILGSYVAFGDTQHCLTHWSVPGNQYWIDASGKFWLNGWSTSGVTFAAGDVIQCAPTGNSIGSYIWARVSGTWYYLYGSAYTFYPWNAGPNPQATNGPAPWALTAVPLTTASPSIGAVTSSPVTNPTVWITIAGSPTTAAPQGTVLGEPDQTHCIFDASHKSYAWSTGLTIIVSGSTSPYGGNVLNSSGFYEIDYLGAIWAWTGNGGQWYTGPTSGSAWTAQHTQGPTLALTPTPLTVGSPALGASPLAQHQFFAPFPITASSPGIGSPPLIQAQMLGGVGVTPASPALGNPPLAQRQVLVAVALAVASPQLDAPPLGQKDVLSPAALTVSSPALGNPSAVIIVAQAAAPLVVGSPALGAPVFEQVIACTAVGVTPASPSIGVPTGGYQLAAGGLSVASPAFGATALAQVQVLAAAPLTVAPPAIGIGQTAGVVGVQAVALVVASPGIGGPPLGQINALATPALAVGSPAFTAPVFAAVAGIGAASLTVGSPAIPVLTFTSIVGLAPAGLVPAGPAIGAPTGGYVAVPTSLAAAPLVLGAPTLGVIVALTAVSSVVASPVIPAVGLGVSGAMAAVGLTVGSPVIAVPTLAPVINFVAINLAAASPVLGTPIPGTAMVATGVAVSSPVLGSRPLTQRQVLTAIGLAVASPQLDEPSITVAGVLAAIPLTVGAPAIGVPSLSAPVELTATSITVSSPAVPPATLTVVVALAPALDLTVASPTLDAAAISEVERLVAPALVVGAPVFTAPVLAGTQIIVPYDLVVGSPKFGAPTMSRAELPPALDINVGSPVIPAVALTRLVQVILSSPITGQIEVPPPIHGDLPSVRLAGSLSSAAITAVVGLPKPLVGGMPTIPPVSGVADTEQIPVL